MPYTDANTVENNYVLNDTAELIKCRFELLPNNLNIILNNNQELFLNKTESGIEQNSNLFLRRGIEHNKRENILETFAMVMGNSLVNLKNLIVSKLTPEVFITLNNGELIDIYRDTNILPNSQVDFDRFSIFIKSYYIFFILLDIDESIIDK